MERRKSLIRAWAADPALSLEDMYDRCAAEGWLDFFVETEEMIREYVMDKVAKGFRCAPLLKSIESSPDAELFAFDATGWSDKPAKPILTKEDMAAALEA